MSFFEQLNQKIITCNTRLCLGIDLHLKSIHGNFLQKKLAQLGPAKFTLKLTKILLDLAANTLPTVKFQSAFFEAIGAEGYTVMGDCIQYAKSKGLLTILDAKRCDISTTMNAYGVSAFDNLGADCLTILPYMGGDVIKALVPWLKQGKGIYSVALSSNPSAQVLQNCHLKNNFSVAACFSKALIDEVENHHIKANDILGFVVGAPYFKDETLCEFIEAFKDYAFLIPGFGAQETQLDQSKKLAKPTLIPHLIPMSRAIVGIGDPSKSKEFEALKTWDDYALLVAGTLNHTMSHAILSPSARSLHI